MISQITGKVISRFDKSITVSVGGLGFTLQIARPEEAPQNKDITLFVHFHWSQDRGPSLFGFVTQLDKSAFLMLIDCHKIGPQIALQILSQVETQRFLELCASAQERELSKLNGVGPKKARQLATELQDKAANLLTTYGNTSRTSCSTAGLRDVSDALKSLGYSPQEISEAMRAAQAKLEGTPAFDVLMRASLSHLAKTRLT